MTERPGFWSHTGLWRDPHSSEVIPALKGWFLTEKHEDNDNDPMECCVRWCVYMWASWWQRVQITREKTPFPSSHGPTHLPSWTACLSSIAFATRPSRMWDLFTMVYPLPRRSALPGGWSWRPCPGQSVLFLLEASALRAGPVPSLCLSSSNHQSSVGPMIPWELDTSCSPTAPNKEGWTLPLTKKSPWTDLGSERTRILAPSGAGGTLTGASICLHRAESSCYQNFVLSKDPVKLIGWAEILKLGKNLTFRERQNYKPDIPRKSWNILPILQEIANIRLCITQEACMLSHSVMSDSLRPHGW